MRTFARLRRGAWLGLALLLTACGDPAAPARPAAAGESPPPTLPLVAQVWATRLPTSTPDLSPNPSPGGGGESVSPPSPPGKGVGGLGAGAAGPPDWTFAVVGDTWKDTPMLRYILRDVAAQGDAFLINLGDMTPQGRPEQMTEFAQLAQGAGFPVYVAPGNHDIAWSKTTAPFERYWPRHQSFDYGNAHFTLVDDSAVTLDTDELAWIKADLAATAQPIKLVFMHVPAIMPYPVPSESALQAGGEEFISLMEQYNVTAVYAAHLHAYTRVTRSSIPYIISGGGGEPLHVPALLGGEYHYLRVAVRGSSISDTLVPLAGVPTPGP